MLGLLIWLAGTVALSYELNVFHLWRPMFAALSLFAWVAWVCGGAAVLSRRGARSRPPHGRMGQFAESVRAQQERDRAAAAAEGSK
jgi:hypothetical protein